MGLTVAQWSKRTIGARYAGDRIFVRNPATGYRLAGPFSRNGDPHRCQGEPKGRRWEQTQRQRASTTRLAAMDLEGSARLSDGIELSSQSCGALIVHAAPAHSFRLEPIGLCRINGGRHYAP